MTFSRLYWVHALSSLHVGTGRGVGFIDLPIARERATNYPVVPGSAVKGVLKDHFASRQDSDRASEEQFAAAFGRVEGESVNAGSLIFSDARLVLLPVRAFKGTFAYVTSPLALRFASRLLEMRSAALGVGEEPAVPSIAGDEIVATSSSALNENGTVYLEDLDFACKQAKAADEWAGLLAPAIFTDPDWQAVFRERFAILADDSFDYFCERGTEVCAHIRIEDNTKTVAQGALWYEESLPAESVLAGLVSCDRVFGRSGLTPTDVMGAFASGTVLCQMGGKATAGKGQVAVCFSE